MGGNHTFQDATGLAAGQLSASGIFPTPFNATTAQGAMHDPGMSCCSCLLWLLPCASYSREDFLLTSSPGISCHSAYAWSTQLVLISGPLHCSTRAVCPKKSNRESTERSARLCNRAVCTKGIFEDAVLRNM